MTTLTKSERILRYGDLAPGNHNEEVDRLEAVESNQTHMKRHGECRIGCILDNLETGWPFDFDPRGYKPIGLELICSFTRLPCQKLKLALIIQQLSILNKSSRGLLPVSNYLLHRTATDSPVIGESGM